MSEFRHGDWMQTSTGRSFWPLDPRPDEIFIEDIAHALANICRFNGHCTQFYSVAQHSVLVSMALGDDLALWGLLHDASEAYVTDVPRPLKPYLEGYKQLEQNVMAAIAERFDLTPDMPAEVKRVDTAILADEAAQIMSAPPLDWNLPEPALGIQIEPWHPIYAKARFMVRFRDLTSQMEA